jgi:hypothetical protein
MFRHGALGHHRLVSPGGRSRKGDDRATSEAMAMQGSAAASLPMAKPRTRRSKVSNNAGRGCGFGCSRGRRTERRVNGGFCGRSGRGAGPAHTSRGPKDRSVHTLVDSPDRPIDHHAAAGLEKNPAGANGRLGGDGGVAGAAAHAAAAAGGCARPAGSSNRGGQAPHTPGRTGHAGWLPGWNARHSSVTKCSPAASGRFSAMRSRPDRRSI